MIVAFEMKLVCNYHEKEDPTGFENSDRNQESEEISCETELEDLRFEKNIYTNTG